MLTSKCSVIDFGVQLVPVRGGVPMDFTAYFLSGRLLFLLALAPEKGGAPTQWGGPSEAKACLKDAMLCRLLRSDTVEEAGDYRKYDIRKP